MKYLFLLVLLLTTLTACQTKQHQLPSVLVQTTLLQKHLLIETITGYGVVTVDPSHTLNITLPNSGQISDLYVTAGQSVSQGASLFSLNTDPNATLAFKQATNALTEAKGELTRTQQLFAQQLATRSQLATTEKNYTDTLQTVNTLKQQGANAKVQNVTAPFSGVITQLNVAQGDRIAAGTTILQISQTNNLLVMLGVEQDDSEKIKVGMPVQLNAVVNGDQSFNSVVSEVHGILDPQTQLVDIVVQLPKKLNLNILPGMRLRGVITIATKNSWAVPQNAVLHDANGYYIYRIDNNIAHRVAVKTGVEDRNLVEIQGDLHTNDRIVTVGNYELNEGMIIREQSP